MASPVTGTQDGDRSGARDGGAGFAGSEFVDELVALGAEVLVVDEPAAAARRTSRDRVGHGPR
jgi:hypothetical protein